MKKGRSNYTLQFNCDGNLVEQVMQNYLQANNFVVYEKKGEKYYRAGDQMVGYKGLLYFINNGTLTINAWLDGALGNFPLEQGLNMFAMNYRNSLSTLFNQISSLSGNSQVSQPNNILNQNLNVNNGQTFNNANNFAQTFQDENNRKQEKLCEIGFWLSILGLLASFFGISYGVLVYIMDFYFASQGLKTRKRNKAIATIILSIISILVIVVILVTQYNEL